ncbi:MAG: tol-pal system-associated acyl-CoA thioesterase [Pseudomonadota bacterium]
MTVHRTHLRVYYEDTDMAGIVYYANYLKYLERGRSDAVREMGIDQLKLRDDAGLVFAVRRVEIDYLRPARFGDTLVVETRTSHVSGAKLVMDQRVLCEEAPVVEASVKVAFMSLEGRVTRFPADVLSALKAAQS